MEKHFMVQPMMLQEGCYLRDDGIWNDVNSFIGLVNGRLDRDNGMGGLWARKWELV